EGDLRFHSDHVGRDRVDDPAAEAGAGVGRLGAAQLRLAAKLDGKQVGKRVEADEQLAPLALDGVADAVGEARRQDGGPGLHAEEATARRTQLTSAGAARARPARPSRPGAG